MPNPTTSDYTRGAIYGLAAVCIWAGFIVASCLGVRTSLTPWDVAAIRFAVAGLLLLPYAWRKGLALERLGWLGVAAMVVGCGASKRPHGSAPQRKICKMTRSSGEKPTAR
jgi:drug/metabolite transporter (DMT)-like permease